MKRSDRVTAGEYLRIARSLSHSLAIVQKNKEKLEREDYLLNVDPSLSFISLQT